ncbi:MAG TPA: hypothetical protein VIY96_03410, partial [Thermoanaerobaculia bacterium]
GLTFDIAGTFRKDQIDFGGWNFTAANSFGSGFERVNVVPGSRIAATLNEQIAISGKPIVLSSRGDSLPGAIQSYIKQAPSLIERTSPNGSRLAPVLAREKTLSPSTLELLKDRAVVVGRGKLAGPGADGFASRGTVVDRGRSLKEALANADVEKGRGRGGDFSSGRKALPEGVIGSGRQAPVVTGPETADVWRGRGSDKRDKVERVAPEAAPSAGDWRGRGSDKRDKVERVAPEAAPSGGDWRGRGSDKRDKVERVAPEVAPSAGDWRGRGSDKRDKVERVAPEAAPSGGDWRGRAPSMKHEAPPPSVAPAEAPRQKPSKQFAREEDWRVRSGSRFEANPAPAPDPRAQEWRRSYDPPAKRVIEGAVPGRRWQTDAEAPRVKPNAPEWRQREAPAPRSYGYEQPREYRPAPAPREYRPEPRQFEPPREFRAPKEYRPEYRQQPPPQAPQYSAPPPQRNEARPAPAPPNVNFKGHGKGSKG